ncbi:MSP7-like protein, partial [Plasmodium falciparum NF54]
LFGTDQSKYDNLNKKMDNFTMNENEYEIVKKLVNMVFPKEIIDTNK